MPVDLGYSKVFLDIFLRGFALAYLALFVYRMMAAAVFPRLCNKWVYWLLRLSIVGVYSLLPVVCESFSVVVVIFFLLLFAPSFILGAIEMGRRWRWPFVLLSCVLETLLFPLWFDLVFLLSLFLEGGD